MWTYSPGYYCWAPMMPGAGFGFSIASYPVNYWVYVNENNLGYSNKYYYGHRSNTAAIVKNSRTIEDTNEDKNRNVKFYSGPKVKEVEKISGREIKPAVIHESEKPQQQLKNNELTIFRPKVETTTVGGKRPAPKNAKNIKEIKPMEKPVPAPRDKTVAPIEKEKPEIKKERTVPPPKVEPKEFPKERKELPPVKQKEIPPPKQEKQQPQKTPPPEKRTSPQVPQKRTPQVKPQQPKPVPQNPPKKHPEKNKAEILFS